MDAYKKLKLEFDGIESTISKYTSDGDITNFLAGLKTGIQVNYGEAIVYYLKEIKQWYADNMSSINSNGYVFNKDSHLRNKEIIEELYEGLVSYNFSKNQEEVQVLLDEKRIFLSHRSSDKKYADALERLIVGLGVKNDQLIYTSHPRHKIPLGANIYDYLRDNIAMNVYMIILWSNNYLESPACLSEMGAAWIVQNQYTSMYTLDFTFSNPKYHECPIDDSKMGIVLNGDSTCRASMIEFKNSIIDYLGLENDEANSSYLIDKFIDEITNI